MSSPLGFVGQGAGLAEEDLGTRPPEAAAAIERTASGSRVSLYGVFVACWAALLPVIFVSTFDFPTFTPKYAVLLLMAGAGLVPLVRLALAPATRWIGSTLLGFLLVGLVSVAISAAPNIGLFGLYRWGSGWLFWLACAGAFAVGSSLRGTNLTWAYNGLLAGCIANAAVAVYQITLSPTSPALRGYAGGTQADGLLGNPVHLEALMLGAIALVAPRACDSLKHWWWALLLFGVALEFTSERLFIPVLIGIAVVLVYRRRQRGLAVSALVLAGCVVGYLSGGSSLSSRVTSGSAETTFGLRLQLWRDALTGMGHHLFLGSGPGELLGGTAPYVNQPFGHALDGRLFSDAHNFFVEVLVTTGVLGFALFASWFVLTVRQARGPFLGFALAVLAVKLVEPLNIGVEPLAFLALGAATVAGVTGAGSLVAAPGLDTAESSPHRGLLIGRMVTVLSVVVMLALGGSMLFGDYSYSKTQLGLQQLAAARSADNLLPYWPESSDALGFYWRYEYSVQHGPTRTSDLLRAERAYVATVDRDPADPNVWWTLAETEQLMGRWTAAQSDFQRSLSDDPWYPMSLGSLASLDLAHHQWSAAFHLYQRLAAVQPLTAGERSAEHRAEANLRS